MVDDERPERRFEYQTDEIVMTDIDCRVLAALPTLMTDGRWPTVADICKRLDDRPHVPLDVVRSCLARLYARYLVEEDDQAFALTVRGQLALKRGVDRPSDHTRYGPSDEAGQPCMGQCGRLAPAPDPGPDEADSQGWLYNPGEDRFAWALLCPDCQKKPEMIDRLDACAFPGDEGQEE